MTATLEIQPMRQRVVESEPVTVRRLVASEWVKFRSLRSSAFMLAGASIGMIVRTTLM